MDLSAMTIRSQRAIAEAHELAAARDHQTVEPEHLLLALLSDPEGIVYPLLDRAGAVPASVRARVGEALDALPRVYAQGSQVSAGSRWPSPTGPGSTWRAGGTTPRSERDR